MPIKLLTVEEHQQVVENLVKLTSSVDGVSIHPAGPEFTSLIVCFLLHNLTAADTLIRLRDSFSNEWFPATVGYVIVRPMFETDVTAHYITRDPVKRARQYIDFEKVLNKREIDAYFINRNSKNIQWRQAMEFMWENVWASKEANINTQYENVRSRFETVKNGGKVISYHNWAGKSIRQIAKEVDHEEAYNIFYAELSSYTHVDVRLANRFLRLRPDELSWSQRPSAFDVGNVFRHAASFLTCFLELFAEQFHVWSKEEVQNCWNVKNV